MKIKNNSTYFIAEIGINHEGSLKRAKKLIKLAKLSGVDAVKFQIFKPETMAQSESEKTDLQKKNTSSKETLFQMWKRVSLKKNYLKELRLYAKKKSLDFICSAFDEESLDFLKSLKPSAIKVASSDINDTNLLIKIKKMKLPVIISTGMASLNEIKNALKIIGKKKTYILHCISMYPVPGKFINILRMVTLKKKLKVNVGYSDHSKTTDASIASIVLGAKVLEKHFTDSKKRVGADHSLSADYNEMKKIINFSKEFNILRGNGQIHPTKKELNYKKYFRKGIYAKKDIKKGELFTEQNIIKRRPSNDTNISIYSKLIGKKAKFYYKKFNSIN